MKWAKGHSYHPIYFRPGPMWRSMFLLCYHRFWIKKILSYQTFLTFCGKLLFLFACFGRMKLTPSQVPATHTSTQPVPLKHGRQGPSLRSLETFLIMEQNVFGKMVSGKSLIKSSSEETSVNCNCLQDFNTQIKKMPAKRIRSGGQILQSEQASVKNRYTG